MDHHPGLGLQVIPGADVAGSEVPGDQEGRVRARDVGAGADQHQRYEHEPGGGQAGVESPAPMKRLPERRREEEAVIGQHHHRRHGHDLFRAHAHRARGDRRRIPGARPRRLRAPNHAIEREQEEQPHQQLGPLHDVGDALGLQRVHDPDQRRRERHPWRRVAVPLTQAGTQQRAPYDPVQRQRRHDVDGQVEGVIAPDVQPAQRVVHGQGKVDDGPRSHRAVGRRGQEARQRPELADARVSRNRAQVVEEEGAAQAVVVGPDAGKDQQNGSDPRGGGHGRAPSGPGGRAGGGSAFPASLSTGRALGHAARTGGACMPPLYPTLRCAGPASMVS